MANAWFRMYAEFATDPKVQMLSEADQRRYLMLLCLRCANGDVTLHETEVAFQLRISNEQWAETKAVLLAKGLIDEACQPTAWDKRQYVSDSSAARVAAHRQRKKQACNVTVTPPDTDTDTDTEKTIYRTLTGTPPNAPASGDSRKKKTPHVYSKDFERAWDNHGRKDGSKFKAEKTWIQLKRSGQLPDLQVILDAQDKQKQSRKWKDGYCPYLQTWLNGRLWEETIQDGDEWGEVEDFR